MCSVVLANSLVISFSDTSYSSSMKRLSVSDCSNVFLYPSRRCRSVERVAYASDKAEMVRTNRGIAVYSG